MVTGVGYIDIRADGRAQLHIHAEITTEDDKKIALFAAGVLDFRANSTVGDLREKRDLPQGSAGGAPAAALTSGTRPVPRT
jgi:hypothetical protein